MIVDGELKVTDLDDASIEESSCTSNSDCFMEFPARNFTLPCSVEGRCQSMNEKRNLYNAYRYVIRGERELEVGRKSPASFRVIHIEYILSQNRYS